MKLKIEVALNQWVVHKPTINKLQLIAFPSPEVSIAVDTQFYSYVRVNLFTWFSYVLRAEQ